MEINEQLRWGGRTVWRSQRCLLFVEGSNSNMSTNLFMDIVIYTYALYRLFQCLKGMTIILYTS